MNTRFRPLRSAAVLLAGLATAAAVSAAPFFLIDATDDGQPPDPNFDNVAFSLIFEDLNMNSLFSLDELVVFGGFTDAGGSFFDQLLEVPNAPGITASNPATNQFRFSDGTTEVVFPAQAFTPFTTPIDVPGVLPVAGSMWLIAAALLTLGLTRRRMPLG